MATKRKRNGPNDKRKAYIRAKLLERRRQLLHSIERKANTYSHRAPVSPGDEGDIAVDIMDTELDLGAATSASESLAEIEHALNKLDEGTYGVCEGCGERIPEPRLRAMPFARLCVRCKEQEEKTQRTGEHESGGAWGRVSDVNFNFDALERTVETLDRTVPGIE